MIDGDLGTVRATGEAIAVLPRRRALAIAVGAVIAAAAKSARADSAVPIPLQAQLLAKVAQFDRNMRARAGDRVVIVIVARKGDGESERAATAMARALRATPTIVDLPVAPVLAPDGRPSNLVALCKEARAAMLYLCAGTDSVVSAVADALEGTDILTIGGATGLAEAGTVVGFELEEGRTKVVVNRKRERLQHVDFRSDFLRIARVLT